MHRMIFVSTLLLACMIEAAHGQERKLERFLLSNSTLSESRAPIYMAKHLGLFEKYGLAAEIVNIRSAAVNVAALLAGEIQMAAAAGVVGVTAAARGAPIAIVATIGPTKYHLVAAPSIRTVQDLKGKIIGIGGYGSGDYFVLLRLLAKLGMTPEKDVTLLPIGSTSSYDRMNLMLAGKVDAVMAIKANIDRVRERGVKLAVLTGSDELGVEVSGGEFFATREFLRSRPGRVKAVLKALADAIKAGRENKEIFHRAVRHYMREENPKLLESFYANNYFFGAGPHGLRPLERALDLDIKDLGATVPELKGRKASEFVDTTLLGEVEKEGFFSWVKP